ncbi:MAG: hypothetical protein FJY54_00295 [Betaproteobacteria bacterium]|nr:hypothetical protein [Betaproteobacteria bacterium]
MKYRLAVAFVSAAAAAATLLLLPLLVAYALMEGTDYVILDGYALVFSWYGIAAVAAFAVAGFILSGERTANLFGFVWFTHPVWSRFDAWLKQRPTLAIFVMLALMVLAVWLYVPRP